MSNPPTSTASRSGVLSLYANLLDPSSSASSSSAASISRGPVVFKQGPNDDGTGNDGSARKQQINPAALRFQPTKRPQLSAQKQKPKPAYPRANAAPASEAANGVIITNAAKLQAKSTLADWAAVGDDENVNGFYGGGEKRQRGGRKKRKKNREDHVIVQDWDDIYDPSRPNSYDEYKHGDEKIREVREWKDRLYFHRIARKQSSDFDSENDDTARPPLRNQFAPPPSYSFAPRPIQTYTHNTTDTIELPDDKTGDDAYARRLKLSQVEPAIRTSVSSPFDTSKPVPPHPENSSTGFISRAAVRYSFPYPPSDLPASESEPEKSIASENDDQGAEAMASGDAPRSLRPGQKGFAERLMTKYGWSKGSGLGADGSGIINPLRVQVEKRKKKPDSEGGGFADPKGIGKIIGGKKKDSSEDSDASKFGSMSEVIVLHGMVDGMNLDEEFADSGDGGLMQEIGDECSEKYGRVERVFIYRNRIASAKVFVKFTSQLSALRAVNALEGRVFNGNTISTRFYDTERFEKGSFD